MAIVKFVWSKVLKKMRGAAIRNSSIASTSCVQSGSQVVNSTFDDYSFCGYDCKIIDTSVGKFCSIADGVVIGVAEHPVDWVSTSPVFYEGRDSVKIPKCHKNARPTPKKTIIGNDVWIGERALIKAGVTIGDGAVIGMGSVVTHDVGPYEIVAGTPAHLIRKRFDEETIDSLLKSQWWYFSREQIVSLSKYFNNPSEFLLEVNHIKNSDKKR